MMESGFEHRQPGSRVCAVKYHTALPTATPEGDKCWEKHKPGEGTGLGLGEGITSSHCGMKASVLGQKHRTQGLLKSRNHPQ